MHPVLDLLKAHHADNFGWALTCCLWHHDMAEDVLQESYLRVLDGRAEFSGRASSRTWFFAVIKRVSADMLRTQKRHGLLNLRMVPVENFASAESSTEQANSPGELVQRQQASTQLLEALKRVSVRQREVLHLVFYADMTLEEAAATLGVSTGSARTHYHRGKERLAQLLGLDEDNED